MASWRPAVEFGRLAHQAEAGIVDHVCRLEISRGERIGQCGDARRRRKIGSDHQRPRMAGRGDLVGERVELGLAPRGQHQRMVGVAGFGEFARQRRADAGGGAGDQAYGLIG